MSTPHLGHCSYCSHGWTFPRDPAVRWPWPRSCPTCGGRLKRVDFELYAGEWRPWPPPPPPPQAAREPRPKHEKRGRPALEETLSVLAAVLADGPKTTREVAVRLGVSVHSARNRMLHAATVRGAPIVYGRQPGHGLRRKWVWRSAPQCSEQPIGPRITRSVMQALTICQPTEETC